MNKKPDPNKDRPDPVDADVPAKPQRRTFTAKYKLGILAELDAAGRGEQGAILRREGVYSSHIASWRAARQQGMLGALSKKRGRKKDPDAAAQRQIAQLKRELEHTKEELRKAHLIMEVQGKVAGLLGLNFDSGKNS
jgi:hypothetical protein